MGRPKAWLPFGPELLLQRVVRLVGEATSPVVVVRAPGQDIPPLPAGVEIVTDAVAGRGPLQGLAAGLAALSTSNEVELVYATGTDAPFLASSWIQRLVERIRDADLAIPFIDGHFQPLAALYGRGTVAPAIEALLASGRFGARSLAGSVRTMVLTREDFLDIDPDLMTLWNLNSPDDYRKALAIAGFDPGAETRTMPPG